MSDPTRRKRSTTVADGLKKMKSENDATYLETATYSLQGASSEVHNSGQEHSTPHSLSMSTPASAAQSPRGSISIPQSPSIKSDLEETVGGDITVKLEPGKAPKLARSSSKKIVSRPPPLFLDVPDSTLEAQQSFDLINECSYANRYLGTTDHALECDCSQEWDIATQTNQACGEDSDCINRATKMECVGECNCGTECQNQRFQRQQYAKVAVIKTEKKGYGLRTDTDLQPNAFIFEYIGEVIGDAAFRKRIVQYDEERIKHFYFMSLTKGEFVDATKKGNLGRFCNHSCNPNCYVDKWVVGEKLRMGIFAERSIAAGEELVFNYNVDRYGADPQPCFCGEVNCTGYIGGKTQTERATKLSTATIEALGIEDGDDWDTAVARKGRKARKTGEADEEYHLGDVRPKSLDEAGVTKVMGTLMQCKEKWIAVKLLGRIQECEEKNVRARVVRMHGYQILNTVLTNFSDDTNIVLQVLDILNKLPRLTRNKIVDSKIDKAVEKLCEHDDGKLKDLASAILKDWNTLEMAYRIPKKEPTLLSGSSKPPGSSKREREERRREPSAARERSRSPSSTPALPSGLSAPTGPRNAGLTLPPRPPPPRPVRRPPPTAALPEGWFMEQPENGKAYYYTRDNQVTWNKPTVAWTPPPPPPPPTQNKASALQAIIDSITRGSSSTERQPVGERPSARESPSATALPSVHDPRSAHGRRSTHEPPANGILLPGRSRSPKVKPKREEKWKSYDIEKRKKVYENTLFPHIKHVMDKFKGKLPREDLKRFAKEIAKKLVNSDFKNNRVEDPTQISGKQEKNVRKFVKEYFEKAVEKKTDHDRRKQADKKSKGDGINGHNTPFTPNAFSPYVAPTPTSKTDDQDIVLSENEIEDEDDNASTLDDNLSPTTDLKRKRETDETPFTILTPHTDASTPAKRPREDDEPSFQVPPPPPPPPPLLPQTDQDQPNMIPRDEYMENGETPTENGTDHQNHINGNTNGNIEEFGTTSASDVTGSFTNEALEAVKSAAKKITDYDDQHNWEEKRLEHGGVSV